MSSMNVFGTNIAAGTDSQKINPSLDLKKMDLNIGLGSGFNKVTFDSLLTSLKSETIDRYQNPSKDYHAEQARRNQEYADNNKAVDNRHDDRRSDESYRAQEKSDINNHDEAYRTETEKHKPEQSDEKVKVEGKEKNIDSAAINKGTEQSGDSNDKEKSDGNAFKVGSLLFELANTKAGELTNDGENMKGGEAVSTETDKESGQGLKNGALLNELIHGKSAETVESALNNGKEAQGLAGIKAGDILKGLVDAKTVEAGKLQTDTAIKSENAQAVNTEAAKTENGLKVGELLNKSADVKTEGIEKELMSAQTKTDNAEGKDTDTEIDELIKKLDKNNPADKKAEIKQEQVKDQKLQDFMTQKDITAGNNAKAAVSKDLPGMVENLFRESGVKPNVNATAKTAGENSDTNNISTLSDISAKSGGLKINAASPTGTIARPSGFADVVNKIVYVAKGDNKLGVTVEHKDLGQLNIKLSLEKGVVNVHINTADKAAREFVESNIQQLVDSLSKSGVSVGGFSVGLKNQQHHEGFSNSNSNKNDKAFSINGVEQQEYSKAAANVYNDNGRVSVFA